MLVRMADAPSIWTKAQARGVVMTMARSGKGWVVLRRGRRVTRVLPKPQAAAAVKRLVH